MNKTETKIETSGRFGSKRVVQQHLQNVMTYTLLLRTSVNFESYIGNSTIKGG